MVINIICFTHVVRVAVGVLASGVVNAALLSLALSRSRHSKPENGYDYVARLLSVYGCVFYTIYTKASLPSPKSAYLKYTERHHIYVVFSTRGPGGGALLFRFSSRNLCFKSNCA